MFFGVLKLNLLLLTFLVATLINKINVLVLDIMNRMLFLKLSKGFICSCYYITKNGNGFK